MSDRPHPAPRSGRGRSLLRLPRRVVAGVLIGIGTIVGAKAEPDQHWSVPPTMVGDVGEHAPSTAGDDRERRATTGDLPACA